MFSERYFPGRYFSPRFWPTLGAVLVVTAAEPIIISVLAEDRRVVVPAETRIITIGAEDRTVVIPDERGTT